MGKSIVREVLNGKRFETSDDWKAARDRLLVELTDFCNASADVNGRMIIEKAMEFTEVEIRFERDADIIGYEYMDDVEWDVIEEKIEALELLATNFCQIAGAVAFNEQVRRRLVEVGLLDPRDPMH